MNDLIGHIQIKVNENIYLKDPDSSELGRRIVREGILLIDKIGLEQFTFRKLANRLDTTESSIYRYFESKQKFLIYLTSWYWGWLEYQLVFSTTNVTSPADRFRSSIEVIARDINPGTTFGNIDLFRLKQIVISESSKAYLTKAVDDSNRAGFYAAYKRVLARISDIVLEINPEFRYPHTLISTIVEGIHHQIYFADHLPSLTDIKHDCRQLANFFIDMAMTTIEKSKKS